MTSNVSERDEWIEADGLGGFASGTATGIRTRRYHALLLAAATPPTGRMVLVNGVDAWLETPGGRVALTSQRYAPGVIHPDGASRIATFRVDPWPTWTYTIDQDTVVEHELVADHHRSLVLLAWRRLRGTGPCRLVVRPFLSGRDYHALQHENPAFRFEPTTHDEALSWSPYDGVPAINVAFNGVYTHAPDWYRHFLYDEELARGLDAEEDLASPGSFTFDLDSDEAVVLFGTSADGALPWPASAARDLADALRTRERTRRAAFPTARHRAADTYLVARGTGRTIVAGYPWFTDWGRDTFIALRGLCLATGRLDEARRILLEWSTTIADGMVPNRFPDRGDIAEFNSVDGSLWFIQAVHELIEASTTRGAGVAPRDRRTLDSAVDAILEGYSRGTRFGIAADEDGLLRAGEPGTQLTWMDAKVGDHVVTPRIGKPVEVQALWLDALGRAGQRVDRWERAFRKGLKSFEQRFWNDAAGCLYDVVDVNHERDVVDASCRPNQVFAIGGLPTLLVSPARARQAVELIESTLWTPMGLRSLSPHDPRYIGRYLGGVHERDSAYHQGTVWPWLLTPFVEAWVRARGGTPRAKQEARDRFLGPLLAHLDEAGLGHVSEIADGDWPHTPRGCPFQAWSLGELLRLEHLLQPTPARASNRVRVGASKARQGQIHGTPIR